MDDLKNNENVSDNQIIEQIKAGADHLFDELIRRHSGKLYQVSYGLLGNREDAEEVVQDAFVRAYKALSGFRGESSFETWIHRIVVNLSRNKYQWNKRRGADLNVSLTRDSEHDDDVESGEERMISDESLGPDTIVQSVEMENRILDGIEKMPEKLKEAMILRHVDDLSYEGIAEMLKCKVGTVKSRLARGRELLKEVLSL